VVRNSGFAKHNVRQFVRETEKLGCLGITSIDENQAVAILLKGKSTKFFCIKCPAGGVFSNGVSGNEYTSIFHQGNQFTNFVTPRKRSFLLEAECIPNATSGNSCRLRNRRATEKLRRINSYVPCVFGVPIETSLGSEHDFLQLWADRIELFIAHGSKVRDLNSTACGDIEKQPAERDVSFLR